MVGALFSLEVLGLFGGGGVGGGYCNELKPLNNPKFIRSDHVIAKGTFPF